MPARAGDGKLLIVGLRCGRLGNRIVLFANLIAYAAEHGYRLINFAFHSYASFFETTRRDIYCRYPIAPTPKLAGHGSRRRRRDPQDQDLLPRHPRGERVE